MTVPFILLATQRSGSTWVQEMLGSHPAVKVYPELFAADAHGMPIWEPSDTEFVNSYWERNAQRPQAVTRRLWTIRYVRELFDQPECAAIGFKYMYDQVRRSPEVLAYAAIARVPVVHLVRRNLLDVVISAELATTTGLYHVVTDGRPKLPWAPSSLDEQNLMLDPAQVLHELHRLTRERARVRAWLRFTRTPTCEIEYETLVGDADQFERVLQFLLIPDPVTRELKAGVARVRTRDLSDLVENYLELEAALLGTPFEQFLSRS